MPVKTRFSLKGKTRDSYLELVQGFPLASVRSEEQLAVAQKVMDRLLAKASLDAGERMYLDALSDLVAAYEDAHHVIEPAADADMLRHFMDAMGVTQAELSRQAGIPRSSLSEVLTGKKAFSRAMIRKLAGYFKIEPSLLAINFGTPDPE